MLFYSKTILFIRKKGAPMGRPESRDSLTLMPIPSPALRNWTKEPMGDRQALTR
jgi:hypothetical protein